MRECCARRKQREVNRNGVEPSTVVQVNRAQECPYCPKYPAKAQIASRIPWLLQIRPEVATSSVSQTRLMEANV